MNTIQSLPPELLVHTFSFLSPSDLLTVALVSRQFSDIVNSEAAWQSAFKRFFRQDKFSSICSSWKDEYLVRSAKWRRAAGVVSFDAQVRVIRAFSIDYQTRRIVTVSHEGTIGFCSSSGIVKNFQVQLFQRPVADITALSCTTKVVAAARLNQVSIFVSGKRNRCWNKYMESTVLRVTCGDNIVVIGTLDGSLILLDLKSGQEIITAQLAARIEFIVLSEKQKSIVVATSKGIFYSDTIDETCTFKKSPLQYSTAEFFLVDFASGFVFSTHGPSITRAHLSYPSETKYTGHVSDIVAAQLDTNDAVQTGPGDGARLLATAEKDGSVYIWDCRGDSEPKCILRTGVSPTTHIALSPIILLVGGARGQLDAFCPLSGDHMRRLHSKRTQECSAISTSLVQGAAAFGKMLTCIDFIIVPPPRRRPRKSLLRNDIQRDINDQIDSLQEGQNQEYLEKWNHTSSGLNDQEALELALLLSKEELGASTGDEELAYVLALSKAEYESRDLTK